MPMFQFLFLRDFYGIMWILSHLEDKHLTLHLNQTFNITPRPVRDSSSFHLHQHETNYFLIVNLSSLARNLAIRWQMSVIN